MAALGSPTDGEEVEVRQAAQVLLDALDVDFHVWTTQALKQFRQTPNGAAFAAWADENPLVFQTLLRLTSIAAQSLSRKEGLLLDLIGDQLARLPAEVLTIHRDESRVGGEERQVIRMGGLSTDDAALIQAAQAPPDLLKHWLVASNNERSLLMAEWISGDLVPLVTFEPGPDYGGAVTPGWRCLVVGRELLVSGDTEQGLRYISAAFVLDPLTCDGFLLWLGNPFVEEAEDVASNPGVLAFVSSEFEADTAAGVLKMRAEGK